MTAFHKQDQAIDCFSDRQISVHLEDARHRQGGPDSLIGSVAQRRHVVRHDNPGFISGPLEDFSVGPSAKASILNCDYV